MKSRVRDEFGYDFIYKETEVRFDAEKFLNEELISKCEIESDLGTQLFQMLVGCIDYAKTFIPSEHQKLVSIADSVIVFLNKSISKRNIAEKNVRFNVSVASFVETFSSSVNSLISNIYDKAAEHLVGEKNKWFKSNYDELVGMELNELKQRKDKYLEFCSELKNLKSIYGEKYKNE